MPIPGLALPDERIWDALNGVMPAWGLLALAPRWRWTMPLVTATAAFYSLLYCATMAGSMLSPEMADMSTAQMFTYEGVAALLAKRPTVLPAWTHYIVFDLWTARWEVQDALRRGVPQLLMAPCLFFTLMLGPAGLLLYLCLRLAFRAPVRGGGAKED